MLAVVFDLHVHSAPDVWPRFADDDGTVAEYVAAGYTGCVLKGHYESTVGRASNAARNQAGKGHELAVYGGIALNQHAGGVNPTAVAVTLNTGGRVIWFPTADAHTQPAAGLPRFGGLRSGMSEQTYAIPPVDPAAECDVRQVCELITEADAVLATGHLSTEEVAWLVPVAKGYGVRRILLTHPGYSVPGMSISEAAEFAEAGALIEITAYQLLHQSDCSAEELAAYARGVGLDNVVLSSDAGQPDSPAPPEALGMLIDALADQGLDRSALLACASDIPRKLVEL
jgi:hypothetical protein